MLVNSRPIRLVICPKAIVDVAVNMDKAALSMSPVLAPLSSVLGAIRPLLLAEAIPEASFPLSSVDSAGLELIRLSLLAWLVWIVQSFRHGLASFFNREVLARSKLLCFQQ
jgi:formate-dependent nitrite reductase membrane component NrfD